MILILIISLSILFFISLISFKYRFLSISVWISGMFLLSTLIYGLNLSYFGEDISLKTGLVIIGSIIFTMLGESFGQRIKLRKKEKAGETEIFENHKPTFIKLSQNKIILGSLYILIIAAYRYWKMFKFTQTVGNSSFLATISYIRPYFTLGLFEYTGLISYLSCTAEALGYLFTIYYFYNLIYFKSNKRYFLIPICSFIIYLITSTGRTGFIKLFLVALTAAILFIYTSHYSFSAKQYKLFKNIITAGVLIAISFYFYGVFIRGSDKTILDYMTDYFSSGLFGLNNYLEDPWSKNEVIGQYSLSNYYYFSNKIFSTDFVIPNHHLPFFYWLKKKSNIYTALAIPIQDYGILGLFLTRFIIATIYTRLVNYLIESKEKVKHMALILFLGFLVYANFSTPIADRYKDMLTVITFPLLMLNTYILNILLTRKKKNKF